jgi:hypothetical protein
MKAATGLEIVAWFLALGSLLLGLAFAFSRIIYRRFCARAQTTNTDQFIIEGMSMGFVAAIFFGVGLVGGLTPSEGQPSLIAWFVYAVLPLGLTLLGFLVVRLWVVRAWLLAEAGGIVALTLHLLRLHRVF